MSKARDLSNLLDTNGDVVSGSLDNVPTPSKTSIEALGIALPAANLTGTIHADRYDGGLESGTKLFFPQAAAPTGWTQDTTASLANRSLRVVTGAGGGTGGSHDLNSPPSTAHTHTGPSHTHTGPSHTHTGSSHTHTHSLSAGAHTLTTAEMPSHSHTFSLNYPGGYYSPSGSGYAPGKISPGSPGTNSTGGGGSHSHSLSGSIASGGAGATGSSGTGATGSSGTGTSGSTTPTAFAPKYIDIILASKD
jgi:hypothetical protein